MNTPSALAITLLVLGACSPNASPLSTADSGSDVKPDAPARACSADAVRGIEVAQARAENPLDPIGYLPYAIRNCTLVYVAKSPSELRIRDLSLGQESVLASADLTPRRPTIGEGFVAWEGNLNGKSVIQLSINGQTTTLSGPWDHAGEPRASGDAVVFTAWSDVDTNSDTDVYLWARSTNAITAIATGPGQQRFADVSATHVAVTDFSEDPSGTYDPNIAKLADVVVYERSSLSKTARTLSGKQAFPRLADNGLVVYLDWGLIHPEPKMNAYGLRIGSITQDTSFDRNVKDDAIHNYNPHDLPSVANGRVQWVDSTADGISMFERVLDLSAPATSVLAGNLIGPAGGETMTLVGSITTSGTVELVAIAH